MRRGVAEAGEGASAPADGTRSRAAGSSPDRLPPPQRYAGPQRLAPALRRLRDRRRLADALAGSLLLEWERGTAFLFLPVLMGTGSILYFSAAVEPAWTSLLASAAALAIAAFLARRRFAAHLAWLAALSVLAGMLAGKAETFRLDTKVLGSEIATRITGTVVSVEEQASGRIRLVLDLVSTERPRLKYAPDRVRVTARKVPPGLVPGALVTGTVRLQPPAGPVRPGGYDFSFQSYFDGIGAVGFFLSGPDLAAPPSGALSDRLRRLVESSREALAARIESRIGGTEGEIAAALLTGARGGIPEPVNEALRKSGLAHILSISGLHMALVAGLVMGLLRIAFALSPSLASRYPVKKIAASGALLATAAYLALSGSDVAALRSFIMLAVVLTALLFDRAALTLRNLAISAVLILAIRPHEVVGPSFQMSYAATAALVGGFAIWSEWRSRRPAASARPRSWPLAIVRTVALYIAGLAGASLIAGTATTLFAVYHFQRLSPLSIPANLLAEPLVALVMLSGLVALMLMPFGLDAAPLWIMGKLIGLVVAIGTWFAERSPLDAAGLVPVPALLALTAAMLLVLLPTTWLRVSAVPFLVAGLVLLAGRDRPDGFIAEDGRLVGIVTAEGRLAVTRERPNAFSVENWQRALMTNELVKPTDAAPAGFSCDRELCIGLAPGGAGVAWAGTTEAARRACGTAVLIVIDDPTAGKVCRSATTITRRDLARHGSAAFRFEKMAPVADFAIREPFRPWHDHRRYSREARGKPSYKAERKAKAESVTPRPEAAR